MDAKARRAVALIRECVTEERFLVLPHFLQRMDQRGYSWPDVLTTLDEPADVRTGGQDEYERPRWIVSGTTFDGLGIELVCVIDADEFGRMTVFITVY